MERRPLFKTPPTSKGINPVTWRNHFTSPVRKVSHHFDLLLLKLAARKDHEKAEFEVHEVYAVDVLISTGEGKVSNVSFSMVFRVLFDSEWSPELWIPLKSEVTVCMCAQAKDGVQRTTIYKRDPHKQYGLKMKTSRMFFSEVERRFDAMPFTLRYLPIKLFILKYYTSS